MAQLYLGKQEINTVFDLRGDKENDITFSLGWALAQSDIFLKRLLKDLFPNQDTGRVTDIHLQKHGKEHRGYTDIEIKTEIAHIVIEAKRGWNLPTEAQLKRYAPSFGKSSRNAIVVMAECEPTYAAGKLPKVVNSVPIRFRSWKQITKIALQSVGLGSHAEKRLLRELAAYLEGLMDMQDVNKSNSVYVIALGNYEQPWAGKGMTWWRYVTKHNLYFQPRKKVWAKEPPNYLGFRWDGELQSIHHIESYETVDDLCGHIPGVRHRQNWMHKPHRLWWLGPPIKPQRVVKTTGLRDTRVLAALDLLLTCKTVTEAREKTRKRLKE